MYIGGIQKLTLLDFPEKLACTVFTAGCNFRCPFCHNAPLVINPFQGDISEEDVFSFLKKRTGILEGVCITGGEPLIQNDIDEFIIKIKGLGFKVKLDTNGYFPEKLIKLVNKGLLDYVAMDIKNSLSKYPLTAGAEIDISNIKKSVDFLMRGFVPYEFRTTVVKEFHTEDDFHSIGSWLKGAEAYYLQPFKDSGQLIQNGLHGYTENEMIVFFNIIKTYIPNAKLRGI